MCQVSEVYSHEKFEVLNHEKFETVLCYGYGMHVSRLRGVKS